MTEFKQPLRIGVGGPVGLGKTAYCYYPLSGAHINALAPIIDMIL